MKTLKPFLLVIAAVITVFIATAAFNSEVITAQQTSPGREVKVINGPADPVPVRLPSDASINVSNFPSFPSFPSSVSHARQNWEYTVVMAPFVVNNPPATAAALQTRLNELGGQGWEFVAGELGGGGLVILKRPRA